jgi:hypothetical protein
MSQIVGLGRGGLACEVRHAAQKPPPILSKTQRISALLLWIAVMEQTGERADRGEIRSDVTRNGDLARNPKSSHQRGKDGRAFGAGVVHERNDMPSVPLPSIGPGMPVPSIPGAIVEQPRGAQGRPIDETVDGCPWGTTLTGSRGATDGRYGYANGDGPRRRLLHRGPQNGASPAMVIRCIRRRLPG